MNTLVHLRCALFSRLLSLPWRHLERFRAKFQKPIFGITPVFPHYRSVALSSPTIEHSDLVSALNTLALVAFEECHFGYTAIAVVFGYGNTTMRLHTHMNDHSPISGIITVGVYVGGPLFVEKGGVLWEGGGGGPAIGTNHGRQVVIGLAALASPAGACARCRDCMVTSTGLNNYCLFTLHYEPDF